MGRELSIKDSSIQHEGEERDGREDSSTMDQQHPGTYANQRRKKLVDGGKNTAGRTGIVKFYRANAAVSFNWTRKGGIELPLIRKEGKEGPRGGSKSECKTKRKSKTRLSVKARKTRRKRGMNRIGVT